MRRKLYSTELNTEGDRQRAMMHLADCLRDEGISKHQAKLTLQQANVTQNNPPLVELDIVHIANAVFNNKGN